MMAYTVFEEAIRQAGAKIMYPEIVHSLADLEMPKEIPVSDNMVVLTAALPFPVAPIRDSFVYKVQEMVKKLGGDIQLKLKGKFL